MFEFNIIFVYVRTTYLNNKIMNSEIIKKKGQRHKICICNYYDKENTVSGSNKKHHSNNYITIRLII